MTDVEVWRTLEADPLVRRQEFPVRVLTSPVGPLPQAFLVLTTAALYLWTEPSAPVLAALVVPSSVSLRGTFALPDEPSAATLLVTDGDDPPWRVEWLPGGGCGCSHPLKHFRPFASPRRAP